MNYRRVSARINIVNKTNVWYTILIVRDLGQLPNKHLYFISLLRFSTYLVQLGFPRSKEKNPIKKQVFIHVYYTILRKRTNISCYNHLLSLLQQVHTLIRIFYMLKVYSSFYCSLNCYTQDIVTLLAGKLNWFASY